MKLPGLFRTPPARQFEFPTRYYDPIKEEIAERTEKIRRELEAKKNGEPYVPSSDFKGKFTSRETADRKSNSIQLIIILVLLLLGWAWWELGDDVIYILFLAVPVYFYFRLRKLFRKS